MHAPTEPTLTLPLPIAPAVRLTIHYRNHRGEIGDRRIVVHSLEWGATEWHPEPQMLLRAYDRDRDDERLFAVRDILALETGDE